MESIVFGSPARSIVRLTTVYMEETCQMLETHTQKNPKQNKKAILLASTLQSHISWVIILRCHALGGMLRPPAGPSTAERRGWWGGWCQISGGLRGWCCCCRCCWAAVSWRGRAQPWWEHRVHVSSASPPMQPTNSRQAPRALWWRRC